MCSWLTTSEKTCGRHFRYKTLYICAPLSRFPRIEAYQPAVLFLNKHLCHKRIRQSKTHNRLLYLPDSPYTNGKQGQPPRDGIVYRDMQTNGPPASHGLFRLMLLGSPPDMVHGAPSHRARPPAYPVTRNSCLASPRVIP